MGKRRRESRPRHGSLLRELPMLIVIALALALVIKTFLVQAFFIPSGSMEPTLQLGDRVLVNKLARHVGGDIERGEIVVFRDPGGWLDETVTMAPANPVVGAVRGFFVFIGLLPSVSEQDLIKRVIAVGGDQVRCCDGQGRVTVNGAPLEEPYVYPGEPPSDTSFDVTIPEGRLWVMGDHRAASSDSRAHMVDPSRGTVPLDAVVGRAFVILWPPGRTGLLAVPPTTEQQTLQSAGPQGAALGAAIPLVGGVLGALPIAALRRYRRSRRLPAGRS
ncbi:MAG: signal peptidase I [Streptomycetales bacterium]